MRHTKRFKILRSQKGSALIMALMATALLGLMASATMTVASIMAAEAQRKSQANTISSFAQMLETVVSNNSTCYGNTTGNCGNGGGQNAIRGICLYNTANGSGNPSKTCDANCLGRGATQNGKLYVALDTSIGIAKNTASGVPGPFETQNVRVREIYLRNVVINGSMATGELVAAMDTITPSFNFAPRVIGNVNMNFNGANTMTGCTASPSAQQICQNMTGCVYDPNATGQKCTCGFPDAECPPGQYLSGLDQTTGEAKCTRVGLNCAITHGPGFFFAGVDAQGKPICLQVEGGYGVQPTPAPTATPLSVGACNPSGAQIPWTDYDGTVGTLCSVQECYGRNYISVADGGTGTRAQFRNCTGNGNPGDTCLDTVEFSNANNCNVSYQCIVYTKTCGGTSAPPPPVCTGGATTATTANAASPAGCFCATGTTWNGSSCVAPPPSNCVWQLSANDVPTRDQNFQYALRSHNFIETILRISVPEAKALCESPMPGGLDKCDPAPRNTQGKPCYSGAPNLYYTTGGNCWECNFICECS